MTSSLRMRCGISVLLSSMESYELVDEVDEVASQKEAKSEEDEKESLFEGESCEGKTLNELYKTLSCISKGSPGTVYIVQNKQDKKKYVLKKIETHDESDAVKAFFEESELKQLDHPYICGYKDFFVTYDKEDSSMFINIISEYFEDGDLAQLIKGYQDRNEPIPEQNVKKMIGEVVEGLVYLHERGIIHRDIKPNNIFLKPSGALVLGDLGVSTVMGDLATNTRGTFQGRVFLAPETLTQAHDERSDLFSFGGVLLNILTAYAYPQDKFVKKLGEMKEYPEVLNEMLEQISEHYSKNIISVIQSLLRLSPTARPNTLILLKMAFIQECMAHTSSSQLDKQARQKETGSTKQYALKESDRCDIEKVLEYVADTIDHEECVAEGLSALADIVRDQEGAHEHIDQKARNLISLAMWDNVFNKDVLIAGCYVLSNLVVYSSNDDILFTPEVITILHKIMTAHEYEPEVQLAAANLILALSAHEQASRYIVQLGGIHDIVVAMRHATYHATLNAVCCMALWSLTVDGENLKIAAKEHAVRDVCIALSTHKVSPEVCEAAAAALVSLLLDDGCYDPFNELDCVGNLVAAISLHPKNAKVVKNCCKVLATVVEANEECAYRFLTSDNPDDDSPTGIPTVMEAYRLHKDNAMVVEAIVRLLLELSSYDEICLDLRAARIPSVLAEIRRKFNDNKFTVTEDINVEMQAALIGPLLLSEVHKRYKENRDIMGPVEEALDRLGSGGSQRSIKSTSS